MSEIKFESYYGISDLGDPYLMHHGIKGMKWGVRRYQNEDGSLTSAGERRYGTVENFRQHQRTKKGILQRQGTRVVGKFNKQRGLVNAVTRNKGIGNKVSGAIGYKALERNKRIDESTQKKLAKQSRTALGQRYHETKAYNAHQLQNYAVRMQSKSTGKRFVESMVFRKELINVPIKRMSGRETTYGAQAVDRLLTGGLAGVVMDAMYINDQRKKKKD